MRVFRMIRSSEDLKTAQTLYYELSHIIAIQVIEYVSTHFFCNGCFIGHGSQLQHDCCLKTDEEKLEELFHPAIESIKIDFILEEWVRRLNSKGIDRDILSLPVNWRRDSHFLNDILSCALKIYGSKTD